MTWSDVYLVCFVVGFSLSVISALGGFSHLQIPGLHHGDGFAFLTWFGGVGYLVLNYSGLLFWAAFFVSIARGLAG